MGVLQCKGVGVWVGLHLIDTLLGSEGTPTCTHGSIFFSDGYAWEHSTLFSNMATTPHLVLEP